jgi:hypothetical protein
LKIVNLILGRREGTEVATFNALLTVQVTWRFPSPSGQDFPMLQQDQIGTAATGKFPGGFDNQRAQQGCNISCGKRLSFFTAIHCKRINSLTIQLSFQA